MDHSNDPNYRQVDMEELDGYGARLLRLWMHEFCQYDSSNAHELEKSLAARVAACQRVSFGLLAHDHVKRLEDASNVMSCSKISSATIMVFLLVESSKYFLGFQKTSAKAHHRHYKCSVPLFEPGQSAVEVSFVNHFDGTSYGVCVSNSYNYPMPIWFPKENLPINGNWSDHSKVAAGLTRVDVTSQADGSVDCKVRWNADLKTGSTSTLSTKNGLLYNYIQDTELAAKEGHFVWYLTPSDWDSGKEVWRYRVGACEIFNNNLQTATLHPDGCVYNMVIGGTVKVCDGEMPDVSYSG